MQDPNEDTEWNDALRKHGILPARPKTPEIEDPEPVDDKVSVSVEVAFFCRLLDKLWYNKRNSFLKVTIYKLR